MPDPFFIPIGNNRVHVHQFGRGPRLLIAFHGFGESGRSFSLFEPLLHPDFTLYAPDLPLHGNTDWKDQYLDIPDLEQLVNRLLDRHGAARFSLLGYSMGGRAVLCLIPLFTGRLEHVILAAPDGLKPNRVYSFVTRKRIGRALFRYVTYHPALFRFILHGGLRFSLMNESIYKFVRRHMRDEKIRKLVFGSWNCMKKINPDMAAIIQCLEKQPLPVTLYFGRYDRIFPPETGDPFKTMPFVSVKIAEGGHQLINPNIAADMTAFLREN